MLLRNWSAALRYDGRVALRFQLHPWDPDTLYTTTDYDQEGDENLDLDFEVGESEWRPIAPGPVAARTVHFVDGARRHDAAGTFGEHPCLFAVMGVGSVTSRFGTRVTPPAHAPARRYVIVGGEGDADVLPVSIEDYGLTYEPRYIEGGEPQLAAEAQKLMLQWEAAHAEELAATNPDDLVLVDGPLRRADSYQNILGYVKTTAREPLPVEQRDVLAALQPGQRSPIYQVHAGDRSLVERLEWVIRPRQVAAGIDPRLGLVRIQANSSLTLEQARALADWSATTLPAYSADYHHDSRAPQQLLIIKNLENDLRRSFGNRDLLLTALRRMLA